MYLTYGGINSFYLNQEEQCSVLHFILEILYMDR